MFHYLSVVFQVVLWQKFCSEQVREKYELWRCERSDPHANPTILMAHNFFFMFVRAFFFYCSFNLILAPFSFSEEFKSNNLRESLLLVLFSRKIFCLDSFCYVDDNKLERTLYIKWMICVYILFLFAPWPILTEVEHSLFLHDFQFYLFILENDEEVSMYFSEISCWPGLGKVALCLVNHKWLTMNATNFQTQDAWYASEKNCSQRAKNPELITEAHFVMNQKESWRLSISTSMHNELDPVWHTRHGRIW